MRRAAHDQAREWVHDAAHLFFFEAAAFHALVALHGATASLAQADRCGYYTKLARDARRP